MKFVLTGKGKLNQLRELKRLEQPTKYYDYTVDLSAFGKVVKCRNPLHCAELIAADPTMDIDCWFDVDVTRNCHMRGWEVDDDES